MKGLCFNPYLPSWEYVPDGEPHVFGDRLYIYGSHDKCGGTRYCEENYVCWSAPVDNLADWRYEGVIYRKDQDPLNTDGKIDLYAPDAAQGPDGRYYLFYALWLSGTVSVAVSDSPAGPFDFYGHVHYPDGSPVDGGVRFDPAILVEEGGNYLYYGFCPPGHFPDMGPNPNLGAYMVQLEDDMLTIRTRPVCVARGYEGKDGTDFEAHPFFEASSIRHYGDLYYFVYSSLQGHELCYATAATPQGRFAYRGVIISNGDIGYKGSMEPKSFYANNHGGLVQVGEDCYIFYHRHTHGTHFSRQGCAEKVEIQANGWIPQVEMTSCGLNKGLLPVGNCYPAYIICDLLGPKGADKIPSRPPYPADAPCLLDEPDPACEKGTHLFLHNLHNGTCCAVKYLDFDAAKADSVSLTLRGSAAKVEVRLDSAEGLVAAEVCSEAGENWRAFTAAMSPVQGSHSVWFCFLLEDEDSSADFSAFEIH